MEEVGGQVETFPHSHRVEVVVLHRSQIRITPLHVQAVLVDHVVAQ